MAAFDRGFLIGQGVPEEAAEAVLAAHEAAMNEAQAGCVPKEEVQRQIDAAMSEALAGCVPKEEAQRQIDAAVSEALAGSVPKEEVQRQIDAAVNAAKADAVDEAEYRALAEERDMLRAIGGEEFEAVKPKFREQVYALLERGPQARPVAEQLEAIREKYEEYFIDEAAPARLPRFGGPTRGSMPRGAMGAADQFSQAWGFGKR